MSALRAALRAYPTLLRVGFAETIAYRAETIVWMLTNTMPLVNLALWSAVARGGRIAVGDGRGYGQGDLTAYFLTALLVRQLTSSWVLWEMEREIRLGLLSMRLLRPIHPLITYSAENISALPLRAGLTVPVAAIAIAIAGPPHLSRDPLVYLVFPLALGGAWCINFFFSTLMGTLNFFLDKALSVFQLWLGAYFVLSGYMFPIDFLNARAPWAAGVIRNLPFYCMAGFPVEALLGLRTRAELLHSLAVQWGYAAVLAGATVLLWRSGVKRFNAYGA